MHCKRGGLIQCLKRAGTITAAKSVGATLPWRCCTTLLLLSSLFISNPAAALTVTLPDTSSSRNYGTYTISLGYGHYEEVQTGCFSPRDYGNRRTWQECYRLQESYEGGDWVEIDPFEMVLVNGSPYRTIYSPAGAFHSKTFTRKLNGTYQYRLLKNEELQILRWPREATCGSDCLELQSSAVAAGPITVTVRQLSLGRSISGPATNDNGSYSLSWARTGGGASTNRHRMQDYILEERLNNGSWSLLHEGNLRTVEKSITGRSDGHWDYRLRKCNPEICTKWSRIHTVTIALAPRITEQHHDRPTEHHRQSAHALLGVILRHGRWLYTQAIP